MKKFKIKLILSFMLLLIAVALNATNYYITSIGSNSNSGTGTTAGTAWQTSAAITSHTFSPGDSILFNRGETFYGSFAIPSSGSAGNPIVIAAYGTGANPIISGFSSVSSWTNTSGNLWHSSSAVTSLKYINVVRVNGSLQAMGRYPKTTDANGGYLTFQSHSGTSSITSNAISGAPYFSGTGKFIGGEVVIRSRHWILDRGRITAQTSTTVTYGTIHTPIAAYEPSDNNGFFFQNDSVACTQQNEWAYDSTNQKLIMYSSSTPSNVEVTAIDTLVKIAGFGYIQFKNLDFEGGNSYLVFLTASSSNTNLDFESCKFSYSYNALTCQNALVSHLTINNCTFSNIVNNGIDFEEAANDTVTNSVFNNIATNGGMGNGGDQQYFGILYIGSNSLIQYNTVSNIGYTGIHLYGSNIDIKNNYVHDFCKIKDDGGGIYIFDNYTPFGVGTNRNVLNNVIVNGGSVSTDYGTNGTASATGIYLDGNASGNKVDGNTCGIMWGACFHTNSGTYDTITNNTFYDGRLANISLAAYSTSSPINNLILKNNIIFEKDSGIVAGFEMASNSVPPSGWGTFDSNYYCRPIFEPSGITQSPCFGLYNYNYCHNGGTIEVYDDSVGSGVDYSLDTWQSTYSQDVHTKKSPKTVTSTDSILFVYNPNNYDSTVTLSAVYMGVDTTLYSGSITLHAYTSAVLIYKQALTVLYDTTRALHYKKARLKFSYNNPVKDYLNMNIPSGYRQSVDFSLNDMWGREFIKKKVQLERGSNRIVFDLSRLASAVYILTMSDIYDEIDHFKILKVN